MRAGLRTLAAAAGLALSATAALAGPADVLEVKVEAIAGGRYRFDVSVRHDDEGWKHFANRWEIVAPDGTVLATRVLRHPHVKQQPFMRSLPSVALPADVVRVTVRAHDLVHGFGGKEASVELPPRAE